MKSNNKGVIILLVIIMLLLMALCILFATNKIKLTLQNQKNTNQKMNKENITLEKNQDYSYSKIKGLYKFEKENLTDESGSEYNATYNLYLYENGTFIYQLSTMASFGYMGNYVIEDSKIKLNYLFSFNSGASIKVTNEKRDLTINSNNTLVDENQPIKTVDLSHITLTKATEKEANDFITSGNDFELKLHSYDIEKNSN